MQRCKPDTLFIQRQNSIKTAGRKLQHQPRIGIAQFVEEHCLCFIE